MGGNFLILRLSFLSLILASKLLAITVLVTKDAIKLEEKLDKSKLIEKDVEVVSKSCEPLTLQDLEDNNYVTTHYINKNSIVCKRSVKNFEDDGIVFNFGGFNIVKKGRIVYENDEFIRFRNLDGTIEQIYKDGRER